MNQCSFHDGDTVTECKRCNPTKKLDHYDVLNAILANDCPKSMEDDGFVRTFEFELHCMTVRIKTRLISTVDTIQYEILEFEMT